MAAARQYQIDVSTTAILLGGTQYKGWILHNVGTGTIFIGDADVLATTGFPILPGAYFSPAEIVHDQLIQTNPDLRLYAIAASGTQDVRVLVAGRT